MIINRIAIIFRLISSEKLDDILTNPENSIMGLNISHPKSVKFINLCPQYAGLCTYSKSFPCKPKPSIMYFICTYHLPHFLTRKNGE
jgi:hypothetical protein